MILTTATRCEDRRGWKVNFKQAKGAPPYEATYYLTILESFADVKKLSRIRNPRWTIVSVRHDSAITHSLQQLLIYESAALSMEPTIVDFANTPPSYPSSSNTLCNDPNSFDLHDKLQRVKVDRLCHSFPGPHGMNYIEALEGKDEVDQLTVSLLTVAAYKDQTASWEPSKGSGGRKTVLRRAQYAKSSEQDYKGWLVIGTALTVLVAVVVVGMAFLESVPA